MYMHCAFCSVMFKDLDIDPLKAYKNMMEAAAKHIRDRHPVEAQRYMAEAALLFGKLNALVTVKRLVVIAADEVAIMQMLAKEKLDLLNAIKLDGVDEYLEDEDSIDDNDDEEEGDDDDDENEAVNGVIDGASADSGSVGL